MPSNTMLLRVLRNGILERAGGAVTLSRERYSPYLEIYYNWVVLALYDRVESP